MKKLKTTAVLQSRAKNTTLSDPKSNYSLQDPLNQKNLKVKAKFHYAAWNASPSFVTVSYWQIAPSGYKILASSICYWDAVKTFKYNKVTSLHHVGRQARNSYQPKLVLQGRDSTSVSHIIKDYCPN